MPDQVKSVIVTGAAGGIGRAACERLAQSGWKVLAVDRDAGKLSWAQTAGIDSLPADITSEADNARMVEVAESRFGGLDAVVLNAAVTGGGAIDAITMERFRQVMEVNLFGTVMGIRAALPALRRRGGGAITITASTMAIAGDAENST
jgi:meso-butanediol dehydrogenase/(S,S)-butanediol dehydrogenase/diacetyl reductase